MKLKEIISRITTVSLGSVFGFAIGCLVGRTVGATLPGGVTLGIAGAAQGLFQTVINDTAKKHNWHFSVTTLAKNAASLLINTAGRIGLIALSILYPGKTSSAAIWTGVGVITGIAQLALTLLVHKAAEHFDWSYSTVLLGQLGVGVLGDIASIVTLVAVGLLAPTGVGLAIAIVIPVILASITLYKALMLKYSGQDVPFRTVLVKKLDPLTAFYNRDKGTLGTQGT